MNGDEVKQLLAFYGLADCVNVVVNSAIPQQSDCIVYAFTNGKIGHWVSVERRNSNHPGGDTLLVDSYGLPSDLAYHVPFLPKGYAWSNINGQNLNTQYCGLYCIAYFILRPHGLNLTDTFKKLYPQHGKIRDNVPSLRRVLGLDPDKFLTYLNEWRKE